MTAVRASLVVLALLAATAMPAVAHAHTFSRSQSMWAVDGLDVQMTALVLQTDLARLESGFRPLRVQDIAGHPTLSVEVAEHIVGSVQFGGDASRCEPTGSAVVEAGTSNRLVVRQSFGCQSEPDHVVTWTLFFDESPTHVHHARIETGEGVESVLLTHERRTAGAGEGGADAPALGFGSALRIGALHVSEGWDHILFVVGLLLLAMSRRRREGSAAGARDVVAAVTGFTLGHSITLLAVAAGRVSVASGPVEILVAISIAAAGATWFVAHGSGRSAARVIVCFIAAHVGLVAVGALPLLAAVGSATVISAHIGLVADGGGRGANWFAFAALFGLIHGMAFAGAFGELIGAGGLLTATLGFNVGVELAQLIVVAVGALVLATTDRWLPEGISVGTRAAFAAVVVGAGAFWVVERAMG